MKSTLGIPLLTGNSSSSKPFDGWEFAERAIYFSAYKPFFPEYRDW